MPGRSRKHSPDKTEFIAPTEVYPSQKIIPVLQIFEALCQSALFEC